MARTRKNRNEGRKASAPSDPDNAAAPIDAVPAAALPAGAAQATDFQFFIDAISDRQIEGWVIRTAQPSHRCVVALREGDRIHARAIASSFRSDLASAGIGDGHHAFVIATPPTLLDGEEHLLEIIEQETGVPLTREPIRWRAGRAATPRAIEQTADDEPDVAAPGPPDGGPPVAVQSTDFRFYLDAVSGKQIEGWIIRTEQPSHRCVVALREGGQIIARAVASRYRADLASAGIGDGHHSFVIPTPPALLDGEEHLLEIIERDSGIPLTRRPIRWRAGRSATHRAIDGMDAGLGRPARRETQSGLTGARSDDGVPRPALPEAGQVTSAASDAPAPAVAGTRILRETRDFRSLVAAYTREITVQLAGPGRRSEN